jgi:hypothetical protein
VLTNYKTTDHQDPVCDDKWQKCNINKKGDSSGLTRGCQMVYFQTKNPNLGQFWRALCRTENVDICYAHLVYIMAIWYMLYPFGDLVAILVHFPPLSILWQEKSGNHGLTFWPWTSLRYLTQTTHLKRLLSANEIISNSNITKFRLASPRIYVHMYCCNMYWCTPELRHCFGPYNYVRINFVLKNCFPVKSIYMYIKRHILLGTSPVMSLEIKKLDD